MNPRAIAIVDIILCVLLIAAIVVALVLYKKQAKCIKGAISDRENEVKKLKVRKEVRK